MDDCKELTLPWLVSRNCAKCHLQPSTRLGCVCVISRGTRTPNFCLESAVFNDGTPRDGQGVKSAGYIYSCVC